MSVVRARCCEIVGDASPRAQVPAAFLLGLCSLLDVMLHCPMKAILSHLDLPPEARDALLGADGPSRLVLECVIAYERGEWDRCFELAGQIDVDPALLAVAHREALSWAAELRR
jgi:EAL and modified HD-GYP domain-containing signal transduction protein